jgi:vitamin B12 transporter
VSLSRGKDGIKGYLNGVEGSHITTVNRQLTWQNELQIADTQRVNLAVERLEQMVESDTVYTQTKRTVNSLLGGYVAEYGAHQAQLNLRQDRYNDFGVANTGLIGYGLSFTDSLRATVSFSSAFKAPTFNDMYAPASWGGNPDLRPERANNREAGLSYASGGQHIDLTYFDNRISDLIAYQFPLMVNVGQARIDGAELGYTGEFGDTGISAAVTSQNPRDTATGVVLLRRAKTFGNLGFTQQLGALKLGGEWQYSGKREDIDINTFARTTLEAYSVVNLTANYALGEQLDLAMRVDNLFDRDYMLAHGYNTLGRTIFVGLNYQQ